MIIDPITIVAKEVAKKAVDVTVEIAQKEAAELPKKIGELTEVETLPDKIDIISEAELSNPQIIENALNEGSDASDSPEKGKPIQNKIDGLQREAEVKDELEKKYSPEEGYEIISEAYLRDADGNIVKDPETGKARRIDFIVAKGGKIIDSIEVTSKTADKSDQLAKESRIRDNGGNYVRDNNGNLIKLLSSVQTRVERRD